MSHHLEPWTTLIEHGRSSPLYTNEGFALQTLKTRLPSLAARVAHDLRQRLDDVPIPQDETLERNDEHGKRIADIEQICLGLEMLERNVRQGHLLPMPMHRNIDQEQSDDVDYWNDLYREWIAPNTWSWHNMPWFVAEAYFFHLLLEAYGYYGVDDVAIRLGLKGCDPYEPQKRLELADDAPGWKMVALSIDNRSTSMYDTICMMLEHCVWGNRADLCYVQVAKAAAMAINEEHARKNTVDRSNELMLVDDSQSVALCLIASHPCSIGIICDNCGAELLMDLLFVDYLLQNNIANSVELHLKRHPTFVSDSTINDVAITLKRMDEMGVEIATIGSRLRDCIREKKLELHDHLFWNGYEFFDRMPSDLVKQLERHRLVIIKGDANYRRLLLDHVWDATTSFEALACRLFPVQTSFVCLRTLKSDPIIGLTASQVELLESSDGLWRVNGKRGVIQACFRSEQ